MLSLIDDTIISVMNRNTAQTRYRSPLIGCARADNPGFLKLREVAGPGHLHPQDLLPGARSVVAFFLPFTADLVRTHRRAPGISREWAVAYIETNHLISRICETLTAELAQAGIRAAWQKPTHNFDKETLTSFWSHKHVAYLCGLGTFGLHHMLITRAGCAVRLGSLVLDAPLPVTPSPREEYCLHRRGRNCAACVRLCPTGALRVDGFDRRRCYRQLLEVNDHFHDLGFSDVCGKCVLGPCALSVPRKPNQNGST